MRPAIPFPAPASRRGARLRALALAAAAWATVERGWAQTAAEEAELELAPVVIEDTRLQDAPLPDRTMETSQDVTGFGETIVTDVSWQSFDSTAELLGQSVGAQLRRQGAREDYSTLSIRGAPAGQIRVLLDGVSLGRADDAVVNLADIPVDAIDRIEVYRGSAPAGLAAASSASVVNIITKDPRGTTAGLASGLGSFGSGKIVGYGSSPLEKGAVSALASLRTTDGDFDYLDDNGTIFGNTFDDTVHERVNNQSDAVSTLLRYRRPLGDRLRVLVRDQFLYKNEGVPGLTPYEQEDATLETTRNIAALALEGTTSDWALESSVLSERAELRDFREEAAVLKNTEETIASSTQARWSGLVAGAHLVGISADLTYETFDQLVDRSNVEGSTRTGGNADRWSLSAAAGDEWTLARWNLTTSVQIRHQQIWNGVDASFTTDPLDTGSQHGNEHSTDPRGGIRWQAHRSLALKGNVGTYFRTPTFTELYGSDGFTTGNPDLKSENGINRDIGFTWTPHLPGMRRFELAYSYFHTDADDVIVVVQDFNRRAKAQNEARAHITGHEVHLEAEGPWGMALSANYTYQDAVNRTDRSSLKGNELPGLPPHEAYARVTWALPWSLPRMDGPIVIAYDVSIDSEHFIDSVNEVEPIPTRTVHGLALVLPLRGGFRLTVEADNLGDTLVPDEIGFPLPGRAFYATLSWSGAAAKEDRDAS